MPGVVVPPMDSKPSITVTYPEDLTVARAELANARARLNAQIDHPPYLRIDKGDFHVYVFSLLDEMTYKTPVVSHPDGAAGIQSLQFWTEEHERRVRDLAADVAEMVQIVATAEEMFAAPVGGVLS